MKIFLYILLGFILLLLGLGTYFYFTFLKTPTLEIEDGENQITAIDRYLTKLQAKGHFNGAILISKEGQSQLMKGYGYTNHLQKEKITPQSSFRLASVSKQFTATGIMILHEKGLLEYDTTVSTYIQDFPYENVTVRHLLHHTSGVPDTYMALAKKYKSEIGEVLTIQKAIELIKKYPKEAKDKPNATYQYNNTGYVLLAGIIENVAEQSFEDFMQQELFTPLGMKNTSVWNLLSKNKTFPNKTMGFDQYDNNKEMKPSFLDGVAGDGAVFSSVEDLLVWDQFWYENDLIIPENLREAFQTPILNDGTVSDYGFGWVVQNEHRVWHNGAWLAAKTIIIRDTAAKSCLVVLDNSANLRFDAITKQISKGLKGI